MVHGPHAHEHIKDLLNDVTHLLERGRIQELIDWDIFEQAIVVLSLLMLWHDLGVITEGKNDTTMHRRLHEDVKGHLDLVAYDLLFDEAQTAVHLRPKVDLLGGCTALNGVFQGRDFPDFFVPALHLIIQSVDEIWAFLDDIVEVIGADRGALSLSLFEFGLDLRVNGQLDHGNLHVLARLREMYL